MRIKKYTSALLLILFSVVTQQAQAPEVEPNRVDLGACVIANTAFQAGEELVYKVFYNWNFVWLSAGEARFNVVETDEHYEITIKGRTYKSYEWFFKVRDSFKATIDKETLLPIQSERIIREGKYRLYDRLTYDHENSVVTSLRGKTKEDARERVYPLTRCMHDMVSILYYARNLNYSAMNTDDRFPVSIFMDKEEWNLDVRYLGKDSNKKIKGQGRYKTISFSPEVIVGDIFKDSDQMKVWATDDENRVPLLIESPVSVGSIKAVLKSHKNLRFPVSSKVK